MNLNRYFFPTDRNNPTDFIFKLEFLFEIKELQNSMAKFQNLSDLWQINLNNQELNSKQD
jgi:hypothetical protein